MKTRHLIYLITGLIVSSALYAFEPGNGITEPNKGDNFNLEVKLPSTSVKDQNKTNTCWSFSTLSFLESELLRKTGKKYDFSEMYIVREVYMEKAERYVRMHGGMNFAAGGEPNDVTNIVKNFGLMPESAYSGLKVDSLNHIHFEMDAVLKDYVNTIIRNPDKTLTNVWLEGFNSILDSYLGELPETFVADNKEYTARSYAKSLDIDPDDYVLITSFKYKPYYSSFVLEVPDNWSWGEVYNVPLNELSEITDYALENGYSTTWSADVSEKGFSFKNGMAVAPKILYEPASKSESRMVSKLSNDKRDELFFNLKKPVEELVVTEENRQKAFDDYSTQDDHGMHILGKATDKNGHEYYYVKNSWGTDNPYNGYLFVSKPYFEYKTIAIMLHKDAIPVHIKNKLNL
jgi:bleomycin hydrolase